MAWETISGKAKAGEKVRITPKRGFAVFNKEACEKFLEGDKPMHLKPFYERSKNLLGFKVVKRSEDGAYTAILMKTGMNRVLHMNGFFKAMGIYDKIAQEASVSYKLTWDTDAGMIVVDLSKPLPDKKVVVCKD